MEQVWLFDRLAVAVFRIDFLDPAISEQPDARERGVRIEIKPAGSTYDGSVYSSSTNLVRPAVCRIDLLESAPHAADRMHWHPTMSDGEPGDRVFDPAIGADPLAWLTDQLTNLRMLLERAGVDDPDGYATDIAAVSTAAAEITDSVAAGLAWARESPWPEVTHDERGLAAVS
jgi:hypothetical protein